MLGDLPHRGICPGGPVSAEAKAKVPKLVEGVRLTELPLDPMDGFVLSRVDGAATVEDIADSTGQTAADVQRVLDRLVEVGAVSWDEVDRSRAPRHTAKRRKASVAPAGTVHTRPPPPGTSRLLYDPSELEEEGVELDPQRRRQVLDTFYRLEELDHYELLGVPFDADKAAIRRAYFSLSKVFHPDTLFGKQLGSYKQKMEFVFRRLTEAYEVLGKKQKRADYDRYLELTRSTRVAQARLEEAERQAAAIERGEEIEEEPAPAAPGEELTGSPAGDATEGRGEDRPSGPVPAGSSAGVPSRSRLTSSPELRRELHARRLAAATGRQVPASAPPTHGAPSTPPSGSASRASSSPEPGRPAARAHASRGQVLRGLTHSLKQAASFTGGATSIERHLRRAKDAESQADLVGATNSLRLAVALAPEREDLQQEYQRLQRALAASLASTYEKQAEYEEQEGRWSAAALSWSRVADGRPDDAKAARRAARAMLEAGGDLKKAKVYAQRAVDLEPRNAVARRTLGRIFVRAGMKLNARRELEEAAKLDPSDDIVKNLLRELKR